MEKYPFLLRNNSAVSPPGHWIGICVQSIAPTTPGILLCCINCLWISWTLYPDGNLAYCLYSEASAMDTHLIIRETVLSWTPNKSPDTLNKNSQIRKIAMQLKTD